VEMLRAELDEAHTANRENRRVIAALTSRIPELPAPTQREASQEPPEARETATEQPGRIGTQSPLEATQEPVQPRAWWRRMFTG
jgi:hypothetical protein